MRYNIARELVSTTGQLLVCILGAKGKWMTSHLQGCHVYAMHNIIGAATPILVRHNLTTNIVLSRGVWTHVWFVNVKKGSSIGHWSRSWSAAFLSKHMKYDFDGTKWPSRCSFKWHPWGWYITTYGTASNHDLYTRCSETRKGANISCAISIPRNAVWKTLHTKFREHLSHYEIQGQVCSKKVGTLSF